MGRGARDAAVDRRMMRLALGAAANGDPSPNPHVGAVVARDGEPIAVGHHERAGLAHAEVAALEVAGERARGATLYVTFEPCNHWGRTGPCTEAILAAGVARVVIGCRDPAPHVPGAIEKLRAAGVEVEVGVLARECERLIADFARHITTGMPFVTLKAAVTLDGRMATRTGDSKWITGERARREAHRMRAESDAVMVGIGTALADDPELTVRLAKGRDPMRVVLDTDLRIPPAAKLLAHRSPKPTLVFHAPDAAEARRRSIAKDGVELVEVPRAGGGSGLALDAVLRELGRRDVVRLLVEGGPRLHGALLESGLVGRAAVFVAPRIVADAEAPPLALTVAPGARHIADAWSLADVRTKRLGPDVLFVGEVVRGAPAP